MNEEFYIGWMAQSPPGFARYVKRVVLGVALLLIIIVIIVATGQKRFSTSRFEYGQLTELTGVYQSTPFPALRLTQKAGIEPKMVEVTIPLVGYGKAGATTVMEALENEIGYSLERKEITLKGSLIYYDGKTLLQIDKNDRPLVKILSRKVEGVPNLEDLGKVSLTGEIIDPKCYFGVMKPGQGKPHKDCAIRCIEGGINPVLFVQNKDGDTDYYLLLNENGDKLSSEIKNNIAEPVSLNAKAFRLNDWVVLYVDKASVKKTGETSWFKDDGVKCRVVKK